MKYLVIETFQSKQGEIQAGQIVSLSKEAAIRLMNEGKAEPVQRTAVKVYSRVLDAFLWVVPDEPARDALKASEGISGAVYTVDEVHRLKGATPGALRRVHETKQTFPGSTVRDAKTKAQSGLQGPISQVPERNLF